uniref:Cullin family profile domain-containing protein n=1 Tax=Chromera velia CCMP2878 TaxID=1169474 RepID=A0A0G4FCL8_9ALVE|mmetsp:Transcript_47664/g.94061  ORF Transcript_47664/g.94061 Transcript_47664/m.94061 type:complete len:786 (+) Transcript_47664:255-2612(+)|eukprot:Cvel_16157.t1-p1 / transcript=Cvel_16157.t1 / gene=Cvel_16157 / organism=Chromera_velia_CCMP2878 / gene_product=Cullin-1, putative / transcript_product=Cullin-1, putative / location=Cvel_scaffold1231:1301-10806(+) / protein_length=785 / sequence_SO=supercontig / SO=protein_coding / is_pseudo=false
MPPIVPLEEGWEKLRTQGIEVLEAFLDTGKAREIGEGDKKKLVVFSVSEYSALYTTVYNMCTQRAPNNWSEKLYERYSSSIAKYVKEKVLPALRSRSGLPLLQELVKRWENHKIYIKWLEKFFSYLDRYYVKLQSVETLKQKGISIFHNLVFEEVKKDAKNAMLEAIDRERCGEKLDQDLFQGALDLYIGLGSGSLDVYVREFEEFLLPATSDFYVKQASGWLQMDSFPEYLRKAEECLREEDLRVERILHRTTGSKVRAVVINALLAQPQRQLLEKETALFYLLENEKRVDLTRTHRLFSLVEDGNLPVASHFRQFVTDKGNAQVDARVEIMKSQPKVDLSDPTFMQSMVDLHVNFKGIVEECFGDDALFQKALKEAFENFINRDVGKFSFAALMSSFCDRILKKSGEKWSDEQVELALSRVVELFAFLTDKDFFAEIYRGQLAKRMLYEMSASDDAEKSMIAKLKLKCGAQFTSKLEGMVNDLQLAGDLQKEFDEHTQKMENPKASLGGMEVSVQVLTTGFWPSYQTHEINLAPEMQKALATFQTFYGQKTSHRRLTWVHTLGSAVLRAQMSSASKVHDLIVNTYQTCILLLYNRETELSFQAIASSLNVEELFVKKQLATLTFGKFRLLKKVRKEPAPGAEGGDGSTTAAAASSKEKEEGGAAAEGAGGKEKQTISSSDSFELNTAFSCPNRKIKIPSPATEESHARERVEEDRSIAIEAAVVRIMKARKTLSHQQLVTETLQQLSFFKPNPRAIKTRIEHLIEREYLERQPGQTNTYRYLA